MIKFTTESGSKYEIDDISRSWKRFRGEGAAKIRSDEGNFITRSDIEIGYPFVMFCPSINPPFSRIIESTDIVSIENVN